MKNKQEQISLEDYQRLQRKAVKRLDVKLARTLREASKPEEPPVSDEVILISLHKLRATQPNIPPQVARASKKWLLKRSYKPSIDFGEPSHD